MRAGSFLRVTGLLALAVPIALASFVETAGRSASASPITEPTSTPALGKTPVASSQGGSGFRLPWAAGATQYLTQDANDDCCADHVGANKFAYDFAAYDGSAFDVVAPAAGTVVHVKMSSNKGCGDSSCVNDANYVVIDHGDGTQTTMLHLAHGSLDPNVACGTFVRRGQRLATTGSTGWSTGVHLHVERDQVKKSLKKTCECGPDGMACNASTAEWNLFWPSVQQPNVAVNFDEWKSASSPGNRRGFIGPSTNVDEHEDVVTVAIDGRFTALTGDWLEAKAGLKGTHRYAAADGKSSGRVSLKGVVTKPGMYEVWAYVPLSSSGVKPSSETTLEVQSAGSIAHGSIDHAASGGAFHPVRGLERVRISGTDADAIVVQSAQADADHHVIADGFVLRRVGPLDAPSKLVATK